MEKYLAVLAEFVNDIEALDENVLRETYNGGERY